MWRHVSTDRGFCFLLCDFTVKQNVKPLHTAFAVVSTVSLYALYGLEISYRVIQAILDSPSTCSVTISLVTGNVVSIQQSSTAHTILGFVPSQPIPSSCLMKLRAPSAARQYFALTVRLAVSTVTLCGEVVWENDSAGSE